MSTDHDLPPTPAADGSVSESEEQLVSTAQQALSSCRWVVGECAAKWTKRYARGRTDGDFGALIGLSGDQVYQRRRVWETFSDVRGLYNSLSWSHFYAAINWDDASECLQWAEETGSTVAEMRAWRRALRGEDLTADPEPFEEGMSVSYLAGEPVFVQDPSDFGRGEPAGGRPRMPGENEHEPDARLAGVARGLDPSENYAPFHQGAIKPPPASDGGGTAVAPPKASPEQLAKRMASTIERCTKAITPEFIREFSELPEKVKTRLIKAVEELAEQVASLS